jgi:hypothetical protein
MNTPVQSRAEFLRLNHLADVHAAKDKFMSAVRPVYGYDRARSAHVHIGSCFLVELLTGKYLVTAAHVTDNFERSQLFVAGHGTMVRIPDDFYETEYPLHGARKDDHFDFAFSRLNKTAVDALAGVGFIRESEISLDRVSPKDRVYVAMGFPCSKNKRIRPHRTIEPKIRVYHSMWKDDPALFDELNLTGDEHLAIHHDDKARDEWGVVVNSIYPEGMSGGPLFDLGKSWHPDRVGRTPRFPGVLIGMLIEYHDMHGALLFVKVRPIFEHIRRIYGNG